MEMDPLIRDPKQEMSRISMDGLRKALLSGLEQQAVQGQLDPGTVAKIALKMADGRTTLEVAVDQVHKEMQKAQADQQNQQGAPEPAPDQTQPGANPDEQPGLANPQQQAMAAQGQPTIGQPPAGLANLKDLLGSLHSQPEASPLANVQ